MPLSRMVLRSRSPFAGSSLPLSWQVFGPAGALLLDLNSQRLETWMVPREER